MKNRKLNTKKYQKQGTRYIDSTRILNCGRKPHPVPVQVQNDTALKTKNEMRGMYQYHSF